MSGFVGDGVVVSTTKRHRRFVGRSSYLCCSDGVQEDNAAKVDVPSGDKQGFPGRRMLIGAAAMAAGILGCDPGTERRIHAEMQRSQAPAVEFVSSSPTAQVVARNTKGSMLEKLKAVPVFAITDQEGRPFLAEVDNVQEGVQASVFFFSYDDAEQVLDKLKREGQEMTKMAEIHVLTMDEAYKKAKGKALPSGITNKNGREILVVFRFYADTREVKEAERILKRDGVSKERVPQVPIFLAQGLTIRLGKDFVVPLYFSKEDLDETWRNVRSKTPDMPKHPPVHVIDLVKVLEGMENNTVRTV